MATLKNRTMRLQVYNLPHSHHCVGDTCYCEKIEQPVAAHDPKTGERGMALVPKSIPRSLTFLAGETKEDLPDTALSCPDVAGAIARRDLVEVK